MASITLNVNTTLNDLLHLSAKEAGYHLIRPLREQGLEILQRHLKEAELPLEVTLDAGNDGPHLKVLHRDRPGRLKADLNACIRFRKGQADLDEHDGQLDTLEPWQQQALRRALTAAYAEFERLEADAHHPDV